MKFFASFAFTCALAITVCAQPVLQLQSYATGFTRPVDIASAGDERLFIVEQRGIIHILNAQGQRLPTPFLNIQSRVNSSGNERGLLGLVFHPNYAQNGFFYVNYTNAQGHTRVSRFRVSDTDPNIADPNSELILIAVNQPFSNHNGGDLNFGPDGYLYIGLGDGGSGGDPQNHSQNRQSLLGKMLRIDVNSGNPYSIPPSNPFVNDPSTLNEIWALGLRNPWRFSFDRLTGDMWIGDVGQNAWEEIDFQPASSTGGENYGWRCYEGNVPFNTNGCQPASAYVFPVHVYATGSASGCSVTGGFVYRGSEFPDLQGHYLFADYCSGRIWSLQPNDAGGWTHRQLLQGTPNSYVSFGENPSGELFLATLGGNIFRVRELCSPFQVSGVVGNELCPGQGNGRIELNITNPGATHTITWSNGATTTSLTNLQPGTYTVTVTNSNTCQRTAQFAVEAAPALPTPELPADTQTLCEGDTIVVAVTQTPAGLGYQWFRNGQPIQNATQDQLLITEPGIYQVAFTSASGCLSSLSDSLSLGPPSLPALPPIIIDGNQLSVSANYVSYQWYFNGAPIAGATNHTYTATQSGTYQVTATTPEGCEYTSAPAVVIISNTLEKWGIRQFRVFPNPTDQWLQIELLMNTPHWLQFRLQDANGRICWQTRERVQDAWQSRVDMSKLPAGVYSLVIQQGKEVIGVWKIVRGS